MKKGKIIIYFILLFQIQLFSQNLQIGFGGAYFSIIAPSYFTDPPGNAFGIIHVNGMDNSVFPSLGFQNSFQFYVNFKYNISRSNILLISNLSYTTLTGSTNLITYNYSIDNPNPDPVIAYPTDVKISKAIFTSSIGGQWNILGNKNSPYIFSEFLLNSFGDTKYNFSRSINDFELTNEGNIKVGVSLGGGGFFQIYDSITLDIGAKYNFDNLNKNKNEGEIKSYSVYCLILFGFDL